MSIWGSAMAGAVGGAGSAVSSLAGKYIDEELSMQKAQALADLQRKTAGAIREDDDAFRNDPTRIARDRENRRQDALSSAAVAREAEKAGLSDVELEKLRTEAADRAAKAGTTREIAKQTAILSDPKLMEAALAKARQEAEAKTSLEIESAKRMAADSEYLKAQERIGLADPKVKAQIEASRAAAAHAYAAAGKYKADAEETKAKTDAIKRVDGLYTEMLKTIDDKTLTPEQRSAQLNVLQSKLMAITPNKGNSGESDTEKITEEKVGPDGTMVKTERTSKRRPDASGGGQSPPYADGTELRGKDGKVYVVHGGQPVLKGSPSAASVARQESPEMQTARAVERMNDEQFQAYKKMQDNQPLSPRERALLRDAGVMK